MKQPQNKPRGRELGLAFPGQPGPNNAITDVPGVMVGYSTVTGENVQTGVTAILPRGKTAPPAYVWAGQHTLNGNGEMTGCHWIHDAGYFISPICITNTHSVGMAHHGVLKWMVEHYPDFFTGKHNFVMPVIAETYDGVINDINGLHITEAHVMEALNSARSGPIEEGNVGGGNGMITYEFKGGTGTASRKIKLPDKSYTLGVLVQSNFGAREDLTVLGVPVGQRLTEYTVHEQMREKEFGSIIVVIATDLPLIPSQLNRIAKRASLGIGRTGTIGGHSSGDIFLAFSTANAMTEIDSKTSTRQLEMLDDNYLNDAYRATRDAVEEAIINAMLAAQTSTSYRPEGMIIKAIDHPSLMRLMLP